MIDVISVKILNVLTNTSLQIGVLVVLVWLLMWAMRIKNARTRHLLWLMVVLSAGVLPSLSIFMPKIELPLTANIWSRRINQNAGLNAYPPLASNAHVSAGKSAQPDGSVTNHPPVEAQVYLVKTQNLELAPQIPSKQKTRLFSMTGLVCIIWVFGVVLMSLRLAKGYAATLMMKGRAREILPGPIAVAFGDVKNRMGLNNAAILVSEDVENPISFGISKPTILMPQSLVGRMSVSEAKLILSHELKHIKRRDCLITLVQRILEAFLFFHPLFRLASNNLTKERERICDDWVIQETQDRIAYARYLTTLMENALNAKSFGVAVAEFARIRDKNDFSRRIEMILDKKRQLATNFSRMAIAICILFGLCIGLIATARVDVFNSTATAQPAADNAVDESFTVKGEIYDAETGKPVRKAHVYAYGSRDEGQYYGPVETDAKGSYVLKNTPAGEYRLRAYAQGFERRETNIVALAAGEATYDFALQKAGSISGKIILPGNLPLKKARVRFVVENEFCYFKGIVTTDADGGYTIVLTDSERIERDGSVFFEQAGQHSYAIRRREYVEPTETPPSPNQYSVKLKAPGYEEVKRSDVLIRGGQETKMGDCYPTERTSTISGKIYDQEGRPISGAEIHLAQMVGEMFTYDEMWYPKVISKADGSYEFPDVSEGYHQLRVEAKDYSSSSRFLPVPKNQTVKRIDFQLLPALPPTQAAISARIFASDGVTPLINSPVWHTQIWEIKDSNGILREGGGGAGGPNYTDEEGRIQLNYLKPRRMRLSLLWNGITVTKELELKGGETTEVDFVMRKGKVALRGQVLRADTKEPIPHLNISLRGPAGYSAITDETGVFEIPDSMVDGKYWLEIMQHEFLDERREIEVTNGVADYLEVMLSTGAEIAGRVLKTDGKPLKDAFVEVKGKILAGTPQPTKEGRYRIGRLEAGPYTVTAKADGYKSVAKQVELKAEEKLSNLDFHLEYEGFGSASGKVTLPDGSPADGATVSFTINPS